MSSVKRENGKGRGWSGRRRWWVLALVGGVVVLIAAWPRAIEAEVGVVAVGPLEVSLDEEGETRVRERFVVSAPVAGRVARLELKPGDRVVAGETVVAAFQPAEPVPLDARARSEAEAALAAAEAALGRARAERQRALAELAFARSELLRLEPLAAAGIVSAGALDQARLLVETGEEVQGAADYSVLAAEGEVRAARARLLRASLRGDGGETLSLRSPIDGVVLRLLRESEGVVPVGEPLLELGDPEDIEVVADFLSSDAVHMRVGYRAIIERWGGDPILATVSRIEPSGFTKISALGVEEQRVNIVLDLDPQQREQWRNLGDRYRVEVRVVVWADDRVVSVPTGALFRSAGEWAVFAIADGRAAVRSVAIGQRNAERAQVLDGLAVGDRVVLYPSDQIADGVRIAAKTAAGSSIE